MNPRFKTKVAILVAAFATALISQVAFALKVGAPDIGDAAATFSMAVTANPNLSFCTGVGGTTYVTQEGGKWSGPITDVSASVPYALNGTLSLNKVVLVLNSTTAEAVAVGEVQFTSSTTPGLTATAEFTIPIQVIDQALDAVGRGEIIAPFRLNGTPTGYKLVSNLELHQSGSTGAISGFLGKTGGAPAVPDISVEYNFLDCK